MITRQKGMVTNLLEYDKGLYLFDIHSFLLTIERSPIEYLSNKWSYERSLCVRIKIFKITTSKLKLGFLCPIHLSGSYMDR